MEQYMFSNASMLRSLDRHFLPPPRKKGHHHQHSAQSWSPRPETDTHLLHSSREMESRDVVGHEREPWREASKNKKSSGRAGTLSSARASSSLKAKLFFEIFKKIVKIPANSYN
jgi:hypothetical protein